MPYLFKLCGSVLSGWITEPLGRKKALIIINIPHLIAWCLLYKSSTLSEIFIANAIFGLGVGLMKAPCATYAGEIWYRSHTFHDEEYSKMSRKNIFFSSFR